MHIVVCDDDLQICKEIVATIQKKYPKHSVREIDDLRAYYLKLKQGQESVPDIVIMDIRWDDADETNAEGIRMSVRLQKLYPRLKIIFLTGFIHYATEIFEARPSAFLVKPVQEKKLYKTLDKVIDEIHREQLEVLSIPSAGGVINVKICDIIYLESNKHELILHLNKEKQHVWMKLDEMLVQLPDYFLRIHQSFAVNANYIQKFGAMNVVLMDGTELSISRSRYKKAKEGFFDYLEGK